MDEEDLDNSLTQLKFNSREFPNYLDDFQVNITNTPPPSSTKNDLTNVRLCPGVPVVNPNPNFLQKYIHR